MAYDREVAGIRCSDVLERLSEYLDGVLDDRTRAAIEGHLAGCDWCERFGGDFAGSIAALRGRLAEPVPPPPEVRARLRERLEDRLNQPP